MSGAPLLTQLFKLLAVALNLSIHFFLISKVVSDGSVNLFKCQGWKVLHNAFGRETVPPVVNNRIERDATAGKAMAVFNFCYITFFYCFDLRIQLDSMASG